MEKKEIIEKLESLIQKTEAINKEFEAFANSLQDEYWFNENKAVEQVSRYVVESQCVFEGAITDLTDALMIANGI